MIRQVARLARAGPSTVPLRPTRPSRLPRHVHHTRPASSLPPTPTPSSQPLRMPADMPREDYAAPAMYTLTYLGRVAKYLAYGIVGISVVGLTTFEGIHMYVEHVCLAAPTSAPTAEHLAGEGYGWADENQGWTGGEKGGTDPRLGWKGRHALRGAWICWEWGAGEGAANAIASSTSRSTRIHPDFRRGVISAAAARTAVMDRGFELAEEYIDVAIAHAEKRGLKFPEQLKVDRPVGPPTTEIVTEEQSDPAVVDLLMLKAGILERIGTPETLLHSRELYELVLYDQAARPIPAAPALNASSSLAPSIPTPTPAPIPLARVVRLAHKLGDLCARSGDSEEAHAWWNWALDRAGVTVPVETGPTPATTPVAGWFSRWRKPASPPALSPLPTLTPALAPPILRAATSVLVSASAQLAQAGDAASLRSASAMQALALSLLPASTRLGTPTSSNAPATLHATWLEHRAALLTLHSASVSHALGGSGTHTLNLAAESSDRAEAVLATLTPKIPASYTSKGSPLAQPARRLLRDTLLTAAEAYYTRAIMLERSVVSITQVPEKIHRLEHAGECYERAMSLAAAESGTSNGPRGKDDESDGVGRGEEWNRYWRGYARVREKLVSVV